MKKVLIAGNVLFLSMAVFFACNNLPVKTVVSKAKCTDCMEYNNIRTPSKLDVNLLRAMTYNYQLDPSTNQIDQNKTRSVWISLEKLKQFVYEVESKTCDCKEATLGVRVYFGKYPNDQFWTNGFQSDLANNNAPDGNFRTSVMGTSTSNPYSNRETIFLVPTINTGNGNRDFDPANNRKGCKGGYDTLSFIARAGGIEKYNNPSTFRTTALGVSITALSATNHGDACPPPVRGCQANGTYSGFDHQ